MEPPSQGQSLREHAQEQARERAVQVPENFETLSLEETQRRLHELTVHQIELEMQNEELLRTHAALEISQARYVDLYDLAPVGYVTVSEEGLIIEANLTAATLLGTVRHELLHQLISRFVDPQDQAQYHLRRTRLMETCEPQAFELRMKKLNLENFWARVDAAVAQDGDGAPVCRVVLTDITEHKRLELEKETERRALEAVARGGSLPDLLEHLVLALEELFPGARGSVLLLDKEGRHLRHGAAPHLPLAFCQAIDGGEIGPNAGSCGTAAFTRASVVAEDIASDPRWRDYKDLALAHGLQSCWSVPIFGAGGRVLGTSAFYFNEPRAALPAELAPLERGAHVVGMVIERHQAEAALSASVEFSDNLIRSMRDGFSVLDMDGVQLDVNPAFCQMTGFSRAQLIGAKPPYAYWPPEHCEAIQAALDAVLQGHFTELELTFLRRSGERFPVLVNPFSVKSKHGDTISFAATVTDITERKAREAQLHQLSLAVEQSAESIIITDVHGRIEYVNEAFVRKTGYSRDETIGQNPRLINSGKTAPEQVAAMWSTITRGETWKGEYINQRKDGSEFIESVSVSPLRQPDGTISHFVALQEDITERNRLTAELDQYRNHLEEMVSQRTMDLVEAREEAETANMAKSSFLANMSHEIRTPMNAIMGMTQLMLLGHPSVEQRDRLGVIMAAAQHLLKIINDILDLARIETGKINLHPVDFSVQGVMDEAVDLLGESLRAKGLTLTCVLDPRMPDRLHGDPRRIGQILLNYGANAAKFTAQGGVTLRVKQIDEGATWVLLRFEVEDTGIGVPAARHGSIFQPFEQADNSMTRRYGGTGLGLSISRHLAKMMGGEVGLSSQEGQGSVFWFTARLEKIKMDSADQKLPSAQASPLDALKQRCQGARVLLVEDQELGRMVAQDMLHYIANIEVDIAKDGVEAVDQAKAQPYDLIFMDMQMPRMDGLDATRLIRALPAHAATPIIGLTANAFTEDRQRCLAAGMNDHLAKPLSIEALTDVLSRWLTVGARP